MRGVFNVSLSTYKFEPEYCFGSLINEKVVSNFVPSVDLWFVRKRFQKSGLEKVIRILLRRWRNAEGREENEVEILAEESDVLGEYEGKMRDVTRTANGSVASFPRSPEWVVPVFLTQGCTSRFHHPRNGYVEIHPKKFTDGFPMQFIK